MATRWRPDTCKCVITWEQFDGDDPVGVTIENACSKHAHHKSAAAHLKAVLKENRKAAAKE